MKTYLVVEGPTDVAVMRRILASADLTEVSVVDGGGKSSATSLGSSIALTRQRPVGVFVDADTRDAQSVREQEAAFNALQSYSPVGSKCRLFLAVPTLEDDLFPDADTFTKILGVQLSAPERASFADQRLAIIKAHLPALAEHPLQRTDVKASRGGWGRPVLKRLLDFLRAPGAPY